MTDGLDMIAFCQEHGCGPCFRCENAALRAQVADARTLIGTLGGSLSNARLERDGIREDLERLRNAYNELFDRAGVVGDEAEQCTVAAIVARLREWGSVGRIATGYEYANEIVKGDWRK